MLSRKEYPVRCECGWPVHLTSEVRGLTFDLEYRSGGINGRRVDCCPRCRERFPLALVLDTLRQQQGEAAA